MASLIISSFTLGVTLSDMKMSPQKFRWIAWHKWLGITVLGLLAIRLIARLLRPAPPLPNSTPQWVRISAKLTHFALYLLMLSTPMVGWLMTSAYGIPIVYLKLVQIPDLIAPNPALAGRLKDLHAALAWTMAFTVMGHVGAAFKHHFIDRDGLMYRMSLFRPR